MNPKSSFKGITLAVVLSVVATAAAAATTQSQPGIQNCAEYSGRDAGEKIAACLASLPNGGIADARGISGVQKISRSLVIDKRGVVLLLGPASEFTLEDGITIDLTGYAAQIIGGGHTTVFLLGNGSSLRVGNATTPVARWKLENFALKPADGKAPGAGIILQNAREGVLSGLSVQRFSSAGASGIEVLDNCWTVRSVENMVSVNDVGYRFLGTNTNAWNIRGGVVYGNHVGLLFDLGQGTAQGMFLTDSVQLENNQSGVWLASGTLAGVFLRDIYAEIKPGQRLIVAAASRKEALHVLRLSLDGGYINFMGTSPVLVRTRAVDSVEATVSNVVLTTGEKLAVAEVTGDTAHVAVQNAIQVDMATAKVLANQ
jgi:hypothetical protein